MNQSFKFKQYQSLKYTFICLPLMEHWGFSFNLLIPSKLFLPWEKDVPPYILYLYLKKIMKMEMAVLDFQTIWLKTFQARN